ncbi:MAG: Gfo/Idh/MocA family protein, partial [Bacillota bacterium]
MILLKKLKVGVIGTGMAFERLHYPAYQQLADRYEIVALSDVDPEKALRWADILHLDRGKAYADYQDMMQRNELDVVDIIVPIELNYAVTEDVARIISGRRAGIICEKPLAPNLEQALAARELPERFNVPIMIAENYRYSQEIDLIRDLVRTGRIGKIFYFVQNRVDNYPEKIPQDKFQAREWRQHPEFPGGAILDTALHDIAGLRHIFGPIHQLQAFGRPQEDDFAPYSVININLLFKNGITGQFTFFPAGQELQRPLIGLRIFGTQGMIYLEERD